MRYLPDTNIFIAALNGKSKVRSALNALEPRDEVMFSVIVWAELYYGAICSAKKDENLKRVDSLRSTFSIIEITHPIAARFSSIKAHLRKQGNPRSDLDLLIAASAIEEDAILITDDRALLDRSIPGLVAENWLE